MSYQRAENMEEYIPAQGITDSILNVMYLSPLISAAHDQKILIDDTYLQKLKSELKNA